MMARYHLRCQLFGHEQDVRAVSSTVLPENGILSGSRDKTSRIWVPNEVNNGFHEGHHMTGHSNFVSSVCFMPPDDKYPNGLIFTGSNDSTICAFTLDSPQPIYTLRDHTSTVCTLATGKFGTLLSGSWDKTAKVWLNQKCVLTLEGHTAAVWAVAIVPEQGLMLTGSADQTIKVWKAGKCQNTIKGHGDCVRGLAVLAGAEFLSCSNDASIRRWLTTGECLAVYYGHTNFVYAITVLGNSGDFASCGEDRTVRVWKNGECYQTVTHPTESIWSVCALPNGDIVSGASDGVIRVFTCDPSRIAASEELRAFEDQVESSTVSSQVGDVKPEDVKDKSVLLVPGQKDGQNVMIKGDKGNIELYSWDAGASQWRKVGDVVGSAGGTTATSGKTLYEGKEYDFVFSVDIQEGLPPLKLPFNIAEDPWFAAQGFIDKHELSQAFLEQVANFIIENSKGATLTQTVSGDGPADPFTGGARYIPGQSLQGGPDGGIDPFTGTGRYVPGQPAPTNTSAGPAADPFTGGGRYVPTYTDTTNPAPRRTPMDDRDPITGASSYHTGAVNANIEKTNKFFPRTTFLTFDAANPTHIIGKLKELNGSAEPAAKVEEVDINGLESVLKGGDLSQQQLKTLHSLLAWPTNLVFPALDVLRLVVKSPGNNSLLCSDSALLDSMMRHWSPDSPPANQMLSLRVVCNMFAQIPGFETTSKNRERVISASLSCKASKNKNVQISLANLLMNFAVTLYGSLDLEGKSQCMSAVVTMLETNPDPEASFRLMIAAGTLIHKDSSLLDLSKSLGIQPHVNRLVVIPEPKKVQDCALLLSELMT